MNMNIVGTGLSGLVGTRVTKLLSPAFTFTDLSRETGVDITDHAVIEEQIGKAETDWIFHFAAYTNVQEAENQKHEGKESLSYKINVAATTDIAKMCRETGKHLLYISTDYIFDGMKDDYSETDDGNPISYYGQTKYEGELAVRALDDLGLVIRISTPYRAFPVGKIDFMHKILALLKDGKAVTSPTDMWFCPTFIDDIAPVIQTLVGENYSGVVHVPARTPTTPFDAAKAIAKTFSVTHAVIHEGSYASYYENKAKAPKQAKLRHDTIDRLGIPLHSFDEGIAEIFREENPPDGSDSIGVGGEGKNI